ncbi:MAG TPA: substrate-binding domain-containing protein, partial [Vicinamibacterales bacterium]|nr:substrate-binding domain-containing protein [Vicinamibacterales bacterium]
MRNPSLFAAVALSAVVAACGGGTSSTSSSSSGAASTTQVRLQGAGSTFDAPLFSKVFDAYQKQSGVEVNYQSIGSGGGVQQLTAG